MRTCESVFLRPTGYFDFESLEIQELIREFKDLQSPREQIKGWYLKVREGWRYNPFVISLTNSHFKASHIAGKEAAHCIDKSILFIAGMRGLGIPARLRLAKVSNHIAMERLEKKLGTNVIAPHGLSEVLLGGVWAKCSPAFNRGLCELYQVDALDFDGTADSIMQEYNQREEKFMEYLEDYGHFDDVPMEFIRDTFRAHYPALYRQLKGAEPGNGT